MREISTVKFYLLLTDSTISLNEDIIVKHSVLHTVLFKVLSFFNILSVNKTFSGEFDGNGHTICNIPYQMYRNLDSDGQIQNVTLKFEEQIEDSVICHTNDGVIKNVDSIGKIQGKRSNGGLVTINKGEIINCTFEGEIQGNSNENLDHTDSIGGIAGRNTKLIKKCSVEAEFDSIENVGGICGINDISGVGKGKIEKSTVYNSKVVGMSGVGGVSGRNKGDISNTSCKESTFKNKSEGSGAGGIVGINLEDGSVENCVISEVCVIGNVNAGGIIGNNYGTCKKCIISEDTNIIGKCSVGGICGIQNKGLVNNCIFEGIVEGESVTGGLIGTCVDGTCRESIVNGTVVPKDTAGYVFGEYTAQFDVADCFYCQDTDDIIGQKDEEISITNQFNKAESAKKAAAVLNL